MCGLALPQAVKALQESEAQKQLAAKAKELARKITADFHGAEAGAKAGEDWAKQFQKDEVPEEVEEVAVALADVGTTEAIRLDKLIALCGLAESVADAQRKIKQGAVKVDSAAAGETRIAAPALPATLMLRVGRKMKKAVIHG